MFLRAANKTSSSDDNSLSARGYRQVLSGVLILGLVIASVMNLSTLSLAADRPNILLIMSDDMGYSDLGCYGGIAKTPQLDALAANGVRFTQFYNTARCCPTRASLLTGLYPHQAGVGHMMEDRGFDGYRGNLNRQCVTIAEVLRPAGYRNYVCGKWHVTPQRGAGGDRANWPLQRGFDKFYGTLAGAGNFFRPNGLCRQNELITMKTDPEYSPERYYYTDAISDNAVGFLQQHVAETPDHPFFLYVAYTAAHWPMHALPEDIAKYQSLFDDGYEPHRQARMKKMKELGVISPDSQLSTAAKNWDEVTHKEWEARCMEVYCAMIDNMDRGIGRIVDQLKKNGQWENTVILFLQDNGACAETIGRAPDSVSAERSGGGARPRTGPNVMPGPADTYIAYGQGWANVSNTPFREYKHWVHEGGISTPLIAHWPTGISSTRQGQLEHQPGHLIDIMATCVELAKADYPSEFQGENIKPREGISLLPALNGMPIERSQPLFWEHEGNRAIREGRWKLVAKSDRPWELYDLETDRTELMNLATSHPERVRDLEEKWNAYAERANVLPLGGWRGARAEPLQGTSKQRLELKAGDRLSPQQSPPIQGRALTITAKIELSGDSAHGVILAQGGTQHGVSLFLEKGKPIFFVRVAGESCQVAGPVLKSGTHTLTAKLSAEGRLSLQCGDQTVEKTAVGRLLIRKPGDGLQVGRDEGGAVGPYPAPNAFSDRIESVVFELEPTVQSGADK